MENEQAISNIDSLFKYILKYTKLKKAHMKMIMTDTKKIKPTLFYAAIKFIIYFIYFFGGVELISIYCSQESFKLFSIDGYIILLWLIIAQTYFYDIISYFLKLIRTQHSVEK